MNFTVYSKDGCPYCTQIKRVLDLCDFKYREYKLDEHFDRFAFYEEFGGNATFPQVQLNGVKWWLHRYSKILKRTQFIRWIQKTH